MACAGRRCDADLAAGTTRAISNELTTPAASVTAAATGWWPSCNPAPPLRPSPPNHRLRPHPTTARRPPMIAELQVLPRPARRHHGRTPRPCGSRDSGPYRQRTALRGERPGHHARGDARPGLGPRCPRRPRTTLAAGSTFTISVVKLARRRRRGPRPHDGPAHRQVPGLTCPPRPAAESRVPRWLPPLARIRTLVAVWQVWVSVAGVDPTCCPPRAHRCDRVGRSGFSARQGVAHRAGGAGGPAGGQRRWAWDWRW